jgi:hypothetical protein
MPAMLKSRFAIIIAIAGLWLAGCVSDPAPRTIDSMSLHAGQSTTADRALPEAPTSGGSAYNPVNDPMITLSARLELATGDVGKIQLDLMTLAKQHNGYLLNSTPEETAIRVEQAKFMDAVAATEKLGQILDKRIYGQSLEAQFQATLETIQRLEETRARLAGELAKSDNAKERQALESQLQEIERQLLAARHNQGGIRRTVHYATITVAHHRKQMMGPITAIFWGAGKSLRWLFVID